MRGIVRLSIMFWFAQWASCKAEYAKCAIPSDIFSACPHDAFVDISMEKNSNKEEMTSSVSTSPPSSPPIVESITTPGVTLDWSQQSTAFRGALSPSICTALVEIGQNVASRSTGAHVVAASSHVTDANGMLDSHNDKYMRAPCSPPSWVIVRLAEDVTADFIGISNLEHYSSSYVIDEYTMKCIAYELNTPSSCSSYRLFRVYGSPRLPTDGEALRWQLIGSFEAEDKHSLQLFELRPRIWVRYVKIEFVSHWPGYQVCTVTSLRVFGAILLPKLDEALDDTEDIDQTIEQLEEIQEQQFEASRQHVSTLLSPHEEHGVTWLPFGTKNYDQCGEQDRYNAEDRGIVLQITGQQQVIKSKSGIIYHRRGVDVSAKLPLVIQNLNIPSQGLYVQLAQRTKIISIKQKLLTNAIGELTIQIVDALDKFKIRITGLQDQLMEDVFRHGDLLRKLDSITRNSKFVSDVYGMQKNVKLISDELDNLWLELYLLCLLLLLCSAANCVIVLIRQKQNVVLKQSEYLKSRTKGYISIVHERPSPLRLEVQAEVEEIRRKRRESTLKELRGYS